MQTAPTRTASRRTALAVGCAAHAVQDGLIATTYVLLPVLAQSFGLTYTQVGLFKGLKSVTQAVLEISSGFLTERVGEGVALVFGLALAGFGFALLSGAAGPALVLGCLLVAGAGSAFQHAPASALVSAAFADGGRRGALGLYNSSGDVGKLVFSAGFSLLVGAGMAWQQIALSYGLAAILAGMAIAIVLGVVPRRRSLARPPGRTDRPAAGRHGWGILDRRAFTTLIVVVTLDTAVQTGLLVFVAFLLIEKGLPLHIATMGAVAVLVGGIFGKAGCGFLAERMGVRRAFALVQVATAAGLVLAVAAPAWIALALLIPLGVVAQGSTSITYGLVPDLIHSDRLARGYALIYASASFASAAGPFLLGVVGDRFGLSTAVLAMAVISLTAVPPVLLLRPAGRAGTA